MTSLATSAECSARSDVHYQAGLSIASLDEPIGHEWAAVSFFYSAYHRVRAAILDDPIFRDAQRLSRVNVKLTMDDRFATHHQGRRSGGEHRLGITEIVPLVYPAISSDYRALASASIDVRYGSQLLAPIADLQARCEHLRQRGDAGELVG